MPGSEILTSLWLNKLHFAGRIRIKYFWVLILIYLKNQSQNSTTGYESTRKIEQFKSSTQKNEAGYQSDKKDGY